MKVLFYSAAVREMDDAFIYYEQQLNGLGIRFIAAVEEAIMRIEKFPTAYSLFSFNTRRCLVNKFPYGVIYSYNSKSAEIFIVAVMHLHREPGYWANRI